ncbi:hypothetical protein V495_04461 [Pseudogymnoascus sp. VKM F-4514 (FW-929)]|nr:hypothetical protein V495_04461 [Pseudogymnoascus sp. VKM F-4514 (FW-929)]KFY64319.1 hypothetical protein V497_01734 [Pseudogymnoascus sp. VKM F-4516 (FW-969)]
MDGHFSPTKESLYHLEMDVKHVHAVQINHADRILRLERRQADDAALKSVWNPPFPGVLNGTPQQGPVHSSQSQVFDDFDDEHGQSLLGSLRLDAEEEPVRRGASRANSVRFDVSATQGSNWAQSSRTSGEFGPARPNSGFGSHPMERTLSHKSDGRHSSAGHSIRSMYSAASGRTSSLGLDTNFVIGGEDDPSPLSIPEPPPGLFILGNVPCIIRCWLNETFSHDTLLYADVCTGSHKSTLEYTLVKQLGYVDRIQQNSKGLPIITLPVYLPEAVITQPSSRANSPAPQLPALTVNFEVTGIHQRSSSRRPKAIHIFLGSDTLRAHSADLLLSQNTMTLYGDSREKLSVPFVRPEDENVFKNICTMNNSPEGVELKGAAPSFTPAGKESKPAPPSRRHENEGYDAPGEAMQSPDSNAVSLPSGPPRHEYEDGKFALDQQNGFSPNLEPVSFDNNPAASGAGPTAGGTHAEGLNNGKADVKPPTNKENENRESVGGRWGSWRPKSDGETQKETVSASGYNKPGRGSRSMKVLKPSKVLQNGRSTSGARHVYEPPPGSPLEDDALRRKSQTSLTDSNASSRWDSKKAVSEDKAHKEAWPISGARRPSNPIGGASAFGWMKASNPKADATTE